MTQKVPKIAPSPAKNEVLDEKPKIVMYIYGDFGFVLVPRYDDQSL